MRRKSSKLGIALAIVAFQAGAVVVLASGPVACTRRPPPGATAEGDDPGDGGVKKPFALALVDAGFDARAHEEMVTAARAALEAKSYDGPYIGAMNMVTSVLTAPAWPEGDAGVTSARLGYLRHGSRVAVLAAEPIVNDSCTDGWYELVRGGYVCGKAATLDLKHPRVRLAPGPPNLEAPLPYRYGYNVTNGTPLYRRVLSMDDRKKYEPWLTAAPAPAAAPAEGESTEGVLASNSEEEEVRPPPPKPARPASSAPTPWFMKQLDGGKPKVALEELRGRGVLVRRMVRGFYLALDKDFNAAHAKWWRTTGGLAVPFERIMLQPPPSDFHGVWVERPADADAGAPKTSNGTVVLVKLDGARKYTIDPETKKATMGDPLPKRRPAALTGTTVVSSGVTFQETLEGFWVRAPDVMNASSVTRPSSVGPTEKWIDVDLTRQTLIAFEGDQPVFTTLISSGRRNLADKEHDYPTPVGTFKIREKHVTATMDGDVASDGPYSIEDVPWVMYFQGSYALHGAFWHNQFGHMRSHGCVNMSPLDARALFNWVEPRLPDAWHGVFAQGDVEGTTVVIHEDPDK